MRQMAVLAVVISRLIRNWDGSAFGVNTTFETHSVGPYIGSMMSASSNSLRMASNCSLFAKGMRRCG